MSRLIAVASVLLALALPALGQDSLNCRQLGLWPGTREEEPEGWAVAVDPDRNLAFLGMTSQPDSGTLNAAYVLDVSDPAQPRVLSVLATPVGYEVTGIAYRSNVLYLGGSWAGLEIWDVADPGAPRRLSTIPAPFGAWRLALAGDYAYLASWGSLRVVDVRDPSNPLELGQCQLPGFAADVKVAGDLAYVASSGGGLRIVNVADPANPYEVGHSDMPAGAWGLDVAGDYVYVADDGWPGSPPDSGYVRVSAVSNPAEPVLVASRHTRTSCLYVALSGNLAYVTASVNGLFVYDITDPAHPLEVGHYRKTTWPPYSMGDVVVTGNLAYLGSWGLRIVEFLGAGVEEPRTAPVTRPTLGLRPNPARYSVNLAGSEGAGLYAPDGRRVALLQPGDNDVRHLARGVYFVRRQDTGESARLVLVR
ncbi:MAG: hypothetical protein R6X12_02950 [bacterium]